MRVLPIDKILPELKAVLSSHTNAVLAAPPGSGKTTRIPLVLLHEPWLSGQRILMLEPRRLAARSAAHYMARLLGESVGQTVGYRVRSDSCIGPGTRIEVITEGILTRMLQTDPGLEGVGLVIFDEFHERSIHADLGLVLALEAQAILRQELRLLVMSATLTAEPVGKLMGDAPLIQGQGQSFPVETHYLERRPECELEAVVTDSVFQALAGSTGDILVFLPGVGEIRRVQAKLTERGITNLAEVTPLYGALPLAAQDAAIMPSRTSSRKVVLATSIAETSLTVEGVNVVIDSGLMRVSRYSPRTGLTSLATIRVSRSAANQRRGRAGRLGPGICYRLWTKQEDNYLEPDTLPEILAADLTALALELAAWGVTAPEQLSWLDAPPEAAFVQAKELLGKLGALETNGAITAHGRQMLETGLQPRLAHMVLQAAAYDLGGLACELAAVLGERDFLKNVDIDLRLRIEAIRELDTAAARRVQAQEMLDIAAGRRIKQEIDRLKQLFGLAGKSAGDTDYCGVLLALAYPDRIGQQRGDGRFLLENGRGASMHPSQLLAHSAYLVAADLDGQGTESRIFLAAPVSLEHLKHYCAQQISKESITAWDSAAQAVRAKRLERLGAIILKESAETNPNPDSVLAALLSGIAKEGLSILPWTKAARQLRQRLLFMGCQDQDWPDVTDETLLKTLDAWLGPYVYGLTSREELTRLNMAAILENLLTWELRQKLDDYAPTHIKVPSGQRIPIDYSNSEAPVLAVKLQEMFGLEETPRIAGGKVALTLQLLSPAQRPIQVTQDLANFWRTTYFDVKKELMGRYPKHYWPEDPGTAIPTHRVRPKF